MAKAKKKTESRQSARAKELLRSLPSVATLLEHEEVIEWLHTIPRATVVASVQAAIDDARQEILAKEAEEPVELSDLLASAEEILLERSMPSLRPVINATGIVLHTGLGRAPLSEAAIDAIVEGASGYCNLELDLETGQRGRRAAHVADLLAEVTGAEAGTVVNNNAAATLLILQAFAADHEVIVSRGELIEIGGSFRLPTIMQASGAKLVEVGTTNRTRIADYENAITENTRMLLKVHPSNFRVVGFTEEVDVAELAELAEEHEIIAVDDLGSGVMLDLDQCGLPAERSVSDSLAAGADLVCFSGDKLLGGPQCGLIVGKSELIEQLESNPLMRTYRVGKLTLLALEATLRAFVDPETAVTNVPTLKMLTASTDALAARAGTLLEQLEAALPDEQFLVCSDVSYAGGGSLPDRELETVVVQWRPADASVEDMTTALRDADVPVVARIRDDAICFDLRTISEDDFESLVASVSEAGWAEDEDEEESDDISLPVL